MSAFKPSDWDGIDEFTAWDAACILRGVPPFTPTRENRAPPHVTAMQTRIAHELQPCRDTARTEAKRTGRVDPLLRVPQFITVTIPGTRYYSRADLEEFANANGLRFLDGNGAKQKEDISTTERGKLLDILYVVAHKYGELDRDYTIAEKILQDAQRLGVNISKDTIAKRIKEARDRQR